MKRWIAFAIVIVLFFSIFALLAQKAMDPADFTGEWYGAEDGQLYRFREGIITGPSDTQGSGDGFCGAYVFCGDRILLFTVSSDGQSELKELYPAGEPKGEFLSETADGTGRIVFSRSNIAAQESS